MTVRQKLRGRLLLLPGIVVVGVTVAGLLTAGGAASGSGARAAGANLTSADSPPDPIAYLPPPSSYAAAGQPLFEANCASCHAPDASGNTTLGAPNLQGLGPATVDFWVSTGRMPLANASAQPVRHPNRFSRKQTLEIVAFVSSLAPTSADFPQGIPLVNTASADIVNGNSMFVLNCAGCHTITGSGDALSGGFYAPSLHSATKTQVVEAVRTGPTQMPHFGPGTLSDKQVADIVAYVTGPIQHPANHGGLGLGEIGPVAEGFIGLFFGVGGLMLVAFWLGDRS